MKSKELIPQKLQEQFKKQHYGLVGKHSIMYTK